MKISKLKKIVIYVSVMFLSLVLLLIYFSGTIDTMLLPKVKTTEVIRGALDGELENPNEDRFLVPLSAVNGFGDSGYVLIMSKYPEGYFVEAAEVTILSQDDMYCEVSSGSIFGGNRVVYSTSKPINGGDRVYPEVG